MSEEQVGFDVADEVVLHDLDTWKDDAGVVPKAQGVRVQLIKPEVRTMYKDNKKDSAEKGSEANPWGFKVLNFQAKIMDGIEETKEDGSVEVKYKGKVVFPGLMDLVFAHNPEVKSSDWWKGRKYLGGFKSLCLALGLDLKEVRINDAFLEAMNGREVLVDIEHESVQENKDGAWVDTGTFKERLRKFNKWE